MKEYYFLKGKDQNGPFTIEQLAEKGLNSETLIWADGMENWQRLEDVSEVAVRLKPKSLPPPPPISANEEIFATKTSGNLDGTTQKASVPTPEKTKASNTSLTWLVIWCGFHLFALLMSYSQISIFNNVGEPQSDKFWPFVEFREAVFSEKQYNELYKYHSTSNPENFKFNGLFMEYDWTEFVFYIGIVLFIYVLIRLSNKQVETEIKN